MSDPNSSNSSYNSSVPNTIFNKGFRKFMHLRVFIDGPNGLYYKYATAVNEHNAKVLSPNNLYVDAGFDLFAPVETLCALNDVVTIDFKVKCGARIVRQSSDANVNGVGPSVSPSVNTGFYMYPRSSLSKTPLRLANSVGIIDSGYRGNVMGKFDCNNHEHIVQQYDRLAQICAPSLMPIYVELVDNTDCLGETLRGDGGFGSSGR
jgi:dUTPase